MNPNQQNQPNFQNPNLQPNGGLPINNQHNMNMGVNNQFSDASSVITGFNGMHANNQAQMQMPFNQAQNSHITNWYFLKIFNLILCGINIIICLILLIGFLALPGILYIAYTTYNLTYHFLSPRQKLTQLKRACCVHTFSVIVIVLLIINLIVYLTAFNGVRYLSKNYPIAFLMLAMIIFMVFEAIIFIICVQIELKMYQPYIKGYAVFPPSNYPGQFQQQQFNGQGGFQQPMYQNQQPIQYGQPHFQQPQQFMNQQQPPMFQQQQPMMINGVHQPLINQQQQVQVQQQQPQLIVSGAVSQYSPPQQNLNDQPDNQSQPAQTSNFYSKPSELDNQV
eukprot:403334961